MLKDSIVFGSVAAFLGRDTLPVLVWANGGCASDSSPCDAFLTTIASHGFLVLATTSINGARDPFPTGDAAPTGYDRYTSPFRAAQDDQTVKFAGTYPLGDNVELLRVRPLQLRCTCAGEPESE